jgi:hypothetical protein
MTPLFFPLKFVSPNKGGTAGFFTYICAAYKKVTPLSFSYLICVTKISGGTANLFLFNLYRSYINGAANSFDILVPFFYCKKLSKNFPHPAKLKSCNNNSQLNP